jgi:hypothetical protein
LKKEEKWILNHIISFSLYRLEILFKGVLYENKYKLLEFVLDNGGGAGIDFLR